MALSAELEGLLNAKSPPFSGTTLTPTNKPGPQVYRGLAGPIIVKDPNRLEPDLPNTYGVDDVPLIVQDRLFGNNGELVYLRSMHDIMMGMQGDTLLVNGVVDPVF